MIGSWRGVTGSAGLTPAQVNFWTGIIKTATQNPVWQAELARLSWSPQFQDGAVLHVYLAQERAEFVTVLGELGLLNPAR